jgi:hypothetical protein
MYRSKENALSNILPISFHEKLINNLPPETTSNEKGETPELVEVPSSNVIVDDHKKGQDFVSM